MQHVADRLAQKVRNPTNGSWWDFDFLCKASQPSLVAETALLKPQISEREEPIMFKQHLTGMFTFALLFLLAAVATQGQAPRTFVSTSGADASDCSRSAPCRNFQRGHDAVTAGGEVVALDSAGYGAVNITKSLTITGEGVHAAATGPSGGGNVVTVNGAGITVILRNIQVQSHPSSVSGSGIFARNFAALHT